MKNKLQLNPGDVIVLHTGLRLENTGDMKITIPSFNIEISSPDKFKLKGFKIIYVQE